MHITLPPSNQPTAIANLQNTCGKYGLLLQSLDGNGSVFIGQDNTALAGALDANGNAPDGFTIQKQTSVTNMPSTIILAPFSGILYARNVGAAATSIGVTIFALE